MEAEAIQSARPVPKPRRTILNAKSLKYENVTIDTKENKVRVTSDSNVCADFTNTADIDKTTSSEINADGLNLRKKINEIENKEDEKLYLKSPPPTPAPRSAKKSLKTEIYDGVRSSTSSGEARAVNKEYANYENINISKNRRNSDTVKSSRTPSPIYADSLPITDSYSLKKSISNSTITSSISSVSSCDNQKYKTPSPGELFKHLSTASKLLTESITERVTTKAKNVKHKINDNIKVSQDLLHNIKTDTASHIKDACGKFHSVSNKKDQSVKKKEKSKDQLEKQMVLNDQVFKTISFQSPIDENPVYGIPKHTEKKVNTVNYNDDRCPSFEEAMKNNSYSLDNFKNNSDKKYGVIASYKIKNENDEIDNMKSLDLSLPKYFDMQQKENPIYGQIRDIQPPTRLKRKQRVEKLHKLNTENPTDSTNLTLNVNSPSRNRKKNERQSNTTKSYSWTYCDENENENENEIPSSPEPIYVNQEITYDKLFDMKTNDAHIMLTPKSDDENQNSSHVFQTSLSSASGDVLSEFDPLQTKSVNDYFTNKSNEILLLEHLMSMETYGSTFQKDLILADENQSSISSDEDNYAVTKNVPLSTPTRQITCQEGNANIIGANMEPMEQSHLAKTDNTTNPLLAQSQTNWFVNYIDSRNSRNSNINISSENPEKTISKSVSLHKMENIEAPPSYDEAIAAEVCTNVNKSNELKFDNVINEIKKENVLDQSKPRVKSMFSSVLTKVDALKRKTSLRSNRSKELKVVLKMIPKPLLSLNLTRHEGALIRFPSGVVEDILKDMQNRKAILRDKKFQTYQDQAMNNPKESFLLENITAIQRVDNNKITDNFTHLYCFEITVAIPKNQLAQQCASNQSVMVSSKDSGNCKLQRVCHLYGVGKESERNIWMQKLFESLTSVFPSKYTCQYYRAGWCYLKNSITSLWSGTWILLKRRKRKLLFYTDNGMNLEKVDLRKARCIILKENDSSTKNLYIEPGPILLIDCPPFTLYLIMSSSRETKIWRHIITEVAHNNGPSLNEQQITKFNVPVIVDKCINFVFIYGSMSEGIYRKSGSENSIQKLISLFRTNAFSVDITKTEYSEHDVANVLKRFMRDLPQKLLGKYSESFCSITHLKTDKEKVQAYKELLSRLSTIEYQTLKKLIGHLSFIATLRSKNKMNVDNLATIWGPTLLQNKEEPTSYSKGESDVISDLIALYKDCFVLSAEELAKEQIMLKCLQAYYSSGESLLHSVKKSGDLKVWISYNDKEGTAVSVTLTPTKTALEICQELATQLNMHSNQLTLFEVILNKDLQRPLHHSEKVFDIVLRWSYWSEIDRKNNCLIIKKNDILKEIHKVIKIIPTIKLEKEFKFADSDTKAFKSFNIEFLDGIILVQKKDKNSINIVKEISLHNNVAYFGCEKKREVSFDWTITFIPKFENANLRSKESPFVGHVLAGNDKKDQILLFSRIWQNLYRGNLFLSMDAK